MKKSHSLRATLLAMLLCATTVPASAQGIFDLPPLTGEATGQAATAPEAATPDAPPADPATLNFTVSPELRAENQKKFLDGMRQLNPAAADELAPHDLIGLLEPELQKFGLRVDNLADAFSAWLMINHAIVNGYDDDPTPEQVDGTRTMTSDALLKMPDLTGASDADKQNTAEVLLLQAMLNQMMYDAAREANPAQVPETVAEIGNASRSMGIDLDYLEMTPNGLAVKQQ